MTEVESMRGVLKVISNGSFLAVIAVREYQAVQARAKQKSLAFWDKTPIGTLPDKLFESIKNTPGTEGGMIQSASWTMMEEVNYDQNGITSFDWTSYPIMRMMDVPEVEVHILDRPKTKPMGAGEAAMGPVAAAIANAVFDASGIRVRNLPIKAEKIDWESIS